VRFSKPVVPVMMLGLVSLCGVGAAGAAWGRSSSAYQTTPYIADASAPSGQPAKTAKKAGKAGASEAPNADVNPKTVGDAYRIGVDDELQISVWKEPELSAPVVVRPDGMITLPLVDDLNVVGQTPKELQALLTEKLKPFVNEPQVTVIVRAIHSWKVYLMGQVPRPGAYPLSDRKTIVQLLAEAGGMNAFAKTSSIYVLRHQNGREIRIPFNYKRAIKGIPDKDEVSLMPGDMVVVP
jgi:polysaccharide export outer membrane protein